MEIKKTNPIVFYRTFYHDIKGLNAPLNEVLHTRKVTGVLDEVIDVLDDGGPLDWIRDEEVIESPSGEILGKYVYWSALYYVLADHIPAKIIVTYIEGQDDCEVEIETMGQKTLSKLCKLLAQ